MEYEDALKFAGVEVHCYQTFGSYQGDWLAKVTYEGETGWIKDYYGSCSGCDALMSAFDFRSHKHEDNDYYDPMWEGFKEGCTECERVKAEFIEFGKNLIDLHSQEEIEKLVSENNSWDLESNEMLEYVKANAI